MTPYAAKLTAFLPVLLLFLVGSVLWFGTAQGAAPAGIPATQRVATTTSVGPQETKTLFAANAACSARIIRTQGEPIYVLFADPTNGDLASTSLTAVAGFYQAASTTVAYDSGLYGCGRMVAESLASTTITIAETF